MVTVYLYLWGVQYLEFKYPDRLMKKTVEIRQVGFLQVGSNLLLCFDHPIGMPRVCAQCDNSANEEVM